MKQVQLKIFKGFNGKVSFDVSTLQGLMPLWNNIVDIIKDKIEIEYFKETKSLLQSHQYLNENESRETIIEALWEFQKSLLPDNYVFSSLSEDEWGHDFEYCSSFEEGKFSSKDYPFYDPEERVITISSFE
jgi:hypothetical protein